MFAPTKFSEGSPSRRFPWPWTLSEWIIPAAVPRSGCSKIRNSKRLSWSKRRTRTIRNHVEKDAKHFPVSTSGSKVLRKCKHTIQGTRGFHQFLAAGMYIPDHVLQSQLLRGQQGKGCIQGTSLLLLREARTLHMSQGPGPLLPQLRGAHGVN